VDNSQTLLYWEFLLHKKNPVKYLVALEAKLGQQTMQF
jgi:hypothetical protein